MGLGAIATRTHSPHLGPYEDVDRNCQRCDGFADEVAGRGQAADGEVGTQFDAASAAGLGRAGLFEGGAAGLEEERCPVGTGQVVPAGAGHDTCLRIRIIVFWIALGETGDKAETHSCGRIRLISSASEVL